MSENQQTEKRKWYQLKPETLQKLRQIGLVFSGVLLYLIYNLQPALLHAINTSELNETWKIYAFGAVPVVLMGTGSIIVILFSLQGQQQPTNIPQQVGTPTAQIQPIVTAQPVPASVPPAPVTPPPI